jgi:hypothetical protein
MASPGGNRLSWATVYASHLESLQKRASGGPAGVSRSPGYGAGGWPERFGTRFGVRNLHPHHLAQQAQFIFGVRQLGSYEAPHRGAWRKGLGARIPAWLLLVKASQLAATMAEQAAKRLDADVSLGVPKLRKRRCCAALSSPA